MKRMIKAASQETSEAFNNALDNLKDDIDYVIDGFEAISRQGKEGENAALQLILQMNESVSAMMKDIADKIAQ